MTGVEKSLTLFRYDMLCFEGIALNLNVFLGRQEFPKYRTVPPADGELQTMIVHEPVSSFKMTDVLFFDNFLDERCSRTRIMCGPPQRHIHESPI